MRALLKALFLSALLPSLALAEESAQPPLWSFERTQPQALAAGAMFVGGALVLGQMARQDISHANRALGVRETQQSVEGARVHATAANVLFVLAGAALTWGLGAGFFGDDAVTQNGITF